ncbi:ABC transporter substrate-binding protein [Microbacterium lushaniae]|uniref:Solute-binding protein family 5 domain-containing protein n=1 Tax=Microbacterium lushaniae TaxID=2614639 RepID=A0A5J6L3L3_9MICO|nr:ABC transporter substrate-binding protein [Microbacterium lushaniae]QEW03209.1 hypothetical protein F6J85_08900 [Microbacterium lushaniae]
MSNRTKRTALVAGAAAMLLAMSACSAQNPEADNGGGDDVERVYIEAISADPTGLNPQFAGGPIPLRFGFAIIGTLVETNDQYEISPGLAKEWEVSADGLSITLHLEEDVQWHDGEPFTSEDVKFNFEEIMPLQTFGKPLTDVVTAIETPDDTTVALTLSRQYGPFMEALSQQAILPKHVYEGTDYVTNPANMAPIGTGPMMFESFTPGESVILVKNPNWWRGETQVDRAVYPVMTDVNARTMALLAGELDSAVIDPAQQDQVETNPALTLTERGVFRQTIPVSFNTQLPELATPEVRSLIFSALDRDAITELGLNGLGEPATTIFPDSLEWAQNREVDFDADFARDLEAIGEGLDEAGYPVKDDGWRFSLDLRYISALTDVAAVAEVVKSSLEDIGVQVNLLGTAEPVYLEAVYQQSDFGLMLLRNTVGADPSLGLTRWMACNPNRIPLSNPTGLCDAEVDGASAGALATMDRDERAKHFKALQARAAELVYWMPLTWSNGANYTVSSERWTGLAEGTGQTNTPAWADMEWNG